MMNIDQLNELVKQGESQRLEFKKSTTQLKSAFETVCAFLNGKGGGALFGVKDNAQLLGQNVTDHTKQELANEIKKIEPYAQIAVHYIPINNDNQIIMIDIQPGKHAPYVYDGRAYERNQSTTEKMTQHRYEQLIIQRGQLNHSWEAQEAHDYCIDDLDHDEIRKTIKEGVDQNRIAIEVLTYDIEHILHKLELIKNGQLTNAAVVLFAKNITNEYSQCAIKLARFKGRDKRGAFIDSQWVKGNAFEIITAAHDFTSRHLPIAGYFEPDNWQRIDQPAIPSLALREALINAISHRDYMIYNTTITLAIYDDRLELWSAGELPSQLKLENLKTPHGSFPRNKNIATVFYKRGWIESWGTGIIRMVGYCNKNKTPEPDFEQYSGGFSTVFRFKEPMHSLVDTSLLHQLTQRQKEIIAILSKEKTMTAAAIKEQLREPLSERTLRYELANLKEKGVVSSRVVTKNTIWFFNE